MHYFSTSWLLQYALLAFLVDLSITMDVDMMVEDGEDFSDEEKLLFQYHNYKNANLLEWKWSQVPFCRAVRPGTVGITYVKVERRVIMLESVNCTKIEVELLTCAGQRRNPDAVFLGWSAVYLSGPQGEIYEVDSPYGKTKCNDPQTAIIQKAIVRGGRGSGQTPRLWGVDEIFEEITLKGFNVNYQYGTRRRNIT